MGFPYRAREEQQAAVRMFGQGDTTLTLQKQCVTMPRRNSHPAFGIEIERGRALKHPEILFCTFYMLNRVDSAFIFYVSKTHK